MKRFEELPISTRTVMAYLNCHFNLENISYSLLKNMNDDKDKKEYNGKIMDIRIPNAILKNIKDENHKKIVEDLNQKKKKAHFKNQITVKLYIEGKIITAKIFRTGKFHVTGCKSKEHRILGCVFLYKKIIDLSDPVDKSYILNQGDENPTIVLDIVMTNIDFDLGFKVDQIAFNDIIQEYQKTNPNENIYSVFDPCLQTSVNLKMEYTDPEKKEYEKITLNQDGTYDVDTIYNYDKIKNPTKRTHTFLIFSSSKVIQSGRFYNTYMRNAYEKFIDIVNTHKNKFEIKN